MIKSFFKALNLSYANKNPQKIRFYLNDVNNGKNKIMFT